MKYGAEAVKRPSEISGDFASSESALIHVLKHLKKEENYSPDLCVFLQCTSPLTLPIDIDGTIDALIEEAGDTALSVTPFHYFLWKKNKANSAVGINHDKSIRVMRQQQEEQFLETGAVYVMKTTEFMKKKHRFFGKTVVYVMPSERCFEIDEPVDLEIARVLLEQQQNQLALSLLPQKIEAVSFNFDGVFTDDDVIVQQNGQQDMICNRGDSMGISDLKKYHLSLVVLSTEKNAVAETRCRKLGLEYHQNLKNKVSFLNSWLEAKGISQKNAIYIGNDIDDAECLKTVGCGVVTADAHNDIKPLAHIVLKRSEACGAVRELCDLIVKKLEKNQNGKSN